MTDDEIFDAIRPIILSATGVAECIKSDPNALAPLGEYCSVSVHSGVNQRGQAIDYSSSTSGVASLDIDIRSQLVSEVSINFYRGQAVNFATRIPQANKLPDISAQLFASGMGWQRAGPINKLTGLQSGAMEERAQVSIYVLHEQPVTAVINSIEAVTWDIEDEDLNTLSTGEIRTVDAP